eukprot:gene31412-38795_t
MSTPNPANTQPAGTAAAPESVKPSNFLRQIIEADLDKGTYTSRHMVGTFRSDMVCVAAEFGGG